MRKRHATSDGGWRNWGILLGIVCLSSILAYIFLSPLFARSSSPTSSSLAEYDPVVSVGSSNSASCCRGVEHLEFWGQVVVWGDKHYMNSSRDCCSACKALCSHDGACLCNSWVYCGDKEKCDSRYRECWLKKQDDPLAPDIQAAGKSVMWMSGLVYGKDTGVVGIETQHGTIRIKLRVDCAPYSAAYILKLLSLRHCVGCQLYRAEGRGSSWDEEGRQIGQTTDGPYALVQGTLATETSEFKEMPTEACPAVQRGSVAWIGGGPDFFMSLANHEEWDASFTIFAHVLDEDMHIVEAIAKLPTVADTWSGTKVAVLQENIPIKIASVGKNVASS